MNCPKCNAEIAEGHRFCTECGYRIEETAPETAPETTPETEAAPSVTDMENVDNHIMWNIQPGQVARMIPEKEFLQYSDAYRRAYSFRHYLQRDARTERSSC